jgi:AI-2 transport protein TqsA
VSGGPADAAERAESSRLFVTLVGLAAAVIVVLGVRQLSDIVGPAFLALVLVLGTQPMRLGLQRHGVPGWVAATLTILTIYVGLIGFTVAMTVTVARFATLLPSYQEEMEQIVGVVVDWLDGQGVGQEQIDNIVGAFDFSRLVALAGDLASSFLGVLSSLFFVITLVLFMVADAALFSQRLTELPAGHEHWVSALTSFGSSIRRYLVVSTVFGLVVAVLDTIALAWLGVPVALLWGLLAFITNYIPNIGFVIGVVPPAVIGLLEGGPSLMISVLVVYSVLNVVIQSIIQPKIVGDAVGLSTTITMLSLVFWAFTLGTMGALLAVPLTLFAKAMLIDADPRAHWVTPLLAGARKPGAARPARRERKARAARPPAAGR